MRRAIARDFAALPSVRVLLTLDDRFPEELGPWIVVPVGANEEETTFSRLVAEADYTALIAPETGGILADRARTIEQAGGRSLGSTPEAIEATADKLQLARHLAERGIRTPISRCVFPKKGLPTDFPYPAILKPIDGAGSQSTYFVADAVSCLEEARRMKTAILQPLVPGVVSSASFLIGPGSEVRLIAAGQQQMNVCDGRFVYEGGTVPVSPNGVALGPRRAAESVPGLRGFVGVDYVWDECNRCATVLEINPRPTTSYVGLSRWLGPGVLARAWLDVVSGAAGSLPDDAMFSRNSLQKTVTFRADGEMIGPDEGSPP
jgi:predicted ATP-grasp superfamily ATP-dependent carboligase